ncbi:hypothetical protein HDF26_004226 [Pedobacter cryoconitis]|uniref:hypothetical protein n=1 Tax=Pedobacter cryoconitis TaxID=188932 RepID=UPI00161AB7B9|nr:hypothetical protein [Pedobacter cryoconitis]MBB6273766.1 hypothetical protein [Pedobacter cryoconitis]
MATTKSRNKWAAALGIVVIAAIGLYAYKKHDDNKFNEQVTANCQRKKYYEIPLISLTGRDSSSIKDVIVELRRNGQTIKTELGLKKTIHPDQSVDLDLYGIGSVHTLVQKQDTILIGIGQEKHVIAGFASNTIEVDHGVLLCQESYEMDGKPFNSDRPNSIAKNGKSIYN